MKSKSTSKEVYIVVSTSSNLSLSVSKIGHCVFYGRSNPFELKNWTKISDLSELKNIENLAEEIAKFVELNDFNKINLVLLQGVSSTGWRESVFVNQISVGILSEKFSDAIKAKKIKGDIVLIGSASAYLGGKIQYASTKASLFGIMNAINSQYKDYVSANLLIPGVFDGRMTADWDEKKRKKIEEKTFANRFAKPDEIADAIRFVSDNDYIAGSVINLSSGQVNIQ